MCGFGSCSPLGLYWLVWLGAMRYTAVLDVFSVGQSSRAQPLTARALSLSFVVCSSKLVLKLCFLFTVYSKLHGLGRGLTALLLIALSASVAERVSGRVYVSDSSGSCSRLVLHTEDKSQVVTLLTFWNLSHLRRRFWKGLGSLASGSRILILHTPEAYVTSVCLL